MLIALILGVFSVSPAAYSAEPVMPAGISVDFLTQQGTMPLKDWTPAELKKLAKSSGEISAQKLIFDESTANLELNNRAEIDVVTVYGANNKIARVPRFMIWRGAFKLTLKKDGSLDSHGESNRLLVPSSLFSVSKINKIELARTSFLYPETELQLRTNPAASRGEKLFTQSCLACHGLPSSKKLKVEDLTNAALTSFAAKHKAQGGLTLDGRAFRGLIAYRDALVIEHTKVESKP